MMIGKPEHEETHASKEHSRSSHGHDTHALPPQDVCDVYKKYQKMSDRDVNDDLNVVDFSRGLNPEQMMKIKPIETLDRDAMSKTFTTFLGADGDPSISFDVNECIVYGHDDFPGLKLYPTLLPPKVQVAFVDRLLHRDLSYPPHKTNLHDSHILPYPPSLESSTSPSQSGSFFSLPDSSQAHMLTPRDPNGKDKPLNLAQFLRKRWRWLTFGAQYDWSTRRYPPQEEVPTSFPRDLAGLVSGLFPRVRAESGVVLIYSPKDFMPVHRDVSELCERELCSFSLGCDGLFVVALDREPVQEQQHADIIASKTDQGEADGDRPQKTVVIRVRSGDMIQMSGQTRWSWHAMPKVMAGTCPTFLRDWPVSSTTKTSKSEKKAHEIWRGYMNAKRINISCRQVYD